MELKKITAVIRTHQLEAVEMRLRELGLKGMTVDRVKGYGEYKQFFSPNWFSDRSRIEIFAAKEEVDSIVAAIIETAHTGLEGDGFVAVLPVERMYRIKTKAEAMPSEI